jgi:TonB family protein
MKLSRTEEKRNRVISVGVALLFFGGLLLFFILTTFNKQQVQAEAGKKDVEFKMELNGSETPGSVSLNKVVPVSSEKKSTSSQSLPSDVGSTVIKYKTRPATSNEAEVTSTSELTPTASVTVSQGTPGGSNISSLHMAFDLAQRKIVQLPKISSDTKEEGKVVVEIVVDRQGNVIEANPNGRGTTTSSAVLKIKARQTAMTAKFSPDEKIEEQKGTITIIFSFN